MLRNDLVNALNSLLNVGLIKDYCPNGLQIEGSAFVQKVITGVTASQALIDRAVEEGADTIIVHHGYFWKNENPVISGMKKRRLSSLLVNDINLIAYHLTLDVHPIYGNNAQLAKHLGVNVSGFLNASPDGVLQYAELDEPISLQVIAERLSTSLNRSLLIEGANDKLIQRLAWCTGGGQGYIDLAANNGMDLFVTGEVSEQTIHSAREQDIAFIAAGHHATERYGVMALAEYLQTQYNLDAQFIDIDNPA